MEHIKESRIVVTGAPDAERIAFLPRHFGPQMLIVERAVYAHLGNLCVDYRGGHWDFFRPEQWRLLIGAYLGEEISAIYHEPRFIQLESEQPL